MNSKYQYRIPFKTKFLNLFRRFFQVRPVEKVLAESITEKSSFLKKLVPPEYLYAPGSWRVIERSGVQLQLDISNVVDHEIYFNQYESFFIDFVKEQISVGLFWDIGANIGWTTLQIAKAIPDIIIYDFEPSSKNRTRLTKNLDLNNIEATVVPYGLGSETNTFKLYSVLENNPGMNRILTTEEDLPFEEIKVILGDYYWQTIGKPKVDLLKIDVEGFEMSVLKGMEELIMNCRPKLFIEVDEKILSANSSSSKELLNWLSQWGYELYVAQTGTHLTPPFVDFPEHFDVIAK